MTDTPIGLFRVTLEDALAGIDCLFGPNGCTREGCTRGCYERAHRAIEILADFGWKKPE